MATFVRALIVVLLAAGLGAVAFLMFWDVPAPRRAVEVVIPGDRLAK